MAKDCVNSIIAETFMELADYLETGKSGKRPKIAITALGSEHGEQNVLDGAAFAAKSDIEVIFIGSLSHPAIRTIKAECEDEAHKIMEKMLESGEIDGAVTMHFPFPIGVSTVGRAISPVKGKEVYLATTTGTASTDRIEGIVKNAIYGIISAKACGIEYPTVGILNVDGARQAEGLLKQLKENGYPIYFASSQRADGGCVLRGNDILTGAADIVATDSLTGNILSKMLSSFNSGGSYEAVGDGYGPGIGEGYEKLVMIISRASGAPVIAGAIRYAADLVKGDYKRIAKQEFERANKAGLARILQERKNQIKPAALVKEVIAPPKEVVTAQLSGIEIMDLEDAVKALWEKGIYAQSGMGCTGPIILVSEANKIKAHELLKESGFITQ